MKLLLTQKNDIFDIILNEGMNPADFHFTEELLRRDEIVTYLRFKDTKYYFMFRLNGVYGFSTQYSPAEHCLEFEEGVCGGWKNLLIRVRKWLRYMRRELNVPDKWEIFQKEISLLPFAFDTDNKNENFSKDELKLIELKIETVKQEITKLNLPIDTIKQINTKLDSLNEKATKLSKTDWKELFIGAIIGTIFNLALPPDASNMIWEIIRQVFKNYILP